MSVSQFVNGLSVGVHSAARGVVGQDLNLAAGELLGPCPENQIIRADIESFAGSVQEVASQLRANDDLADTVDQDVVGVVQIAFKPHVFVRRAERALGDDWLAVMEGVSHARDHASEHPCADVESEQLIVLANSRAAGEHLFGDFRRDFL